jgi:hypothetical protein
MKNKGHGHGYTSSRCTYNLFKGNAERFEKPKNMVSGRQGTRFASARKKNSFSNMSIHDDLFHMVLGQPLLFACFIL